MSLTKTTKQSYESYLVYGDFSEVMADDEAITDYLCTAEDANGSDATVIVLTPGSEVIGTGDDYAFMYVRVRDGEVANSPYKVTIKVTTSTGNKWEVDGLLVIKEL